MQEITTGVASHKANFSSFQMNVPYFSLLFAVSYRIDVPQDCKWTCALQISQRCFYLQFEMAPLPPKMLSLGPNFKPNNGSLNKCSPALFAPVPVGFIQNALSDKDLGRLPNSYT